MPRQLSKFHFSAPDSINWRVIAENGEWVVFQLANDFDRPVKKSLVKNDYCTLFLKDPYFSTSTRRSNGTIGFQQKVPTKFCSLSSLGISPAKALKYPQGGRRPPWEGALHKHGYHDSFKSSCDLEVGIDSADGCLLLGGPKRSRCYVVERAFKNSVQQWRHALTRKAAEDPSSGKAEITFKRKQRCLKEKSDHT